jgi:hypothetical protein
MPFLCFSQYDLAGIRFFETINDTHYSRFPEPFLAMKAILIFINSERMSLNNVRSPKDFEIFSTER